MSDIRPDTARELQRDPAVACGLLRAWATGVLSTAHEAIIALIRDNPRPIIEWLREVCGISWSAEAIAPADAELPQMVPPSFRCDLVLELGDNGRAGIIVEVQLGRDSNKPWTWPLYFHQLRERLRGDVLLVVITRDRAVAQWAARSLRYEQPGTNFRPIVLGPDNLARITDVETARRCPDLALLSALIHAGQDGGDDEIVPAIEAAVSTFSDGRGMLYATVIAQYASKSVELLLERLMLTFDDTELKFRPFRQLIERHTAKALAEGLAEGKAEGLAEGLAEGEAKGLTEGEAKGLAKGRAESLLTVLSARGMTVSGPQRDRILACRDPAQLKVWLRAAVTVESVDVLLER